MNSITEPTVIDAQTQSRAPTLSHPDAALIGWCARLARIRQETTEIYVANIAAGPVPDEMPEHLEKERVERFARLRPLEVQIEEAFEVIVRTEALTKEGIDAKLDVYLPTATRIVGANYERAGCISSLLPLAHSIARDTKAAISSTPEFDAEVSALVGEFWKHRVPFNEMEKLEKLGRQDVSLEADRLCDLYGAAVDAIAVTPARSLLGLAYKGQIIKEIGLDNREVIEHLIHSLVEDCAALHAERPTARLTLNPDAELIEVCRQVDALEDELVASSSKTIAEERANDLIKDPIRQRQHLLIEELSCNLTSTTLEGHQARARTIVKWAPDLIGTPDDFVDMMVSALLQDLIAQPTGGEN